MILKMSVNLRQVVKWYLGRKNVRRRGEVPVGIDVRSKARKLRGPAFCCIALNMPQPLNKRLFKKPLSILCRKSLGPYLLVLAAPSGINISFAGRPTPTCSLTNVFALAYSFFDDVLRLSIADSSQ